MTVGIIACVPFLPAQGSMGQQLRVQALAQAPQLWNYLCFGSPCVRWGCHGPYFLGLL